MKLLAVGQVSQAMQKSRSSCPAGIE